MSAIAGRVRCFTCVSGPEPGSHWAVTGSHPAQIEKTRMSTSPCDELGHDCEREPDDRDAAIRRLAHSKAGEDAAEDPERHDEDEREGGELERVAGAPAR